MTNHERGKGEQIDLEVADVVYRGRGLARLGGRVVFLPDVLPGESVRARVTRKRKRFWEAEPREVLHRSPERQEPFCPIYSKCPGCCYQHASYRAEVGFKQSQLENLLRRMGGVAGEVFGTPVSSPLDRGYRNRITLHARAASETTLLGYFGYDNRSVVDVPGCPIARPEINVRLHDLRNDGRFLRSLKAEGSVRFRSTPRNGVVVSVQPGTTEDGNGSLSGTELVCEETALGIVETPLGSFFQTNPAVADLLAVRLMNLLEAAPVREVVDLYCGSGIFSLAAARTGIERVVGVDRDGAAVRCARKNADAHGLQGVSFIAGSVVAGLQEAVASMEPHRAAVIVDPPRRGLQRSGIGAIARFRPRHLFYISCAADTLSRDVKELRANGYEVMSSQLFDMFPRTPYFESITHLAVRSGSNDS
jgi:23S rRNA (uracil1939-C5)-methyltransferase/tRNA (uracil-5-)-methyltransferase